MAKIGRNTACPCGSGIKYKLCCQKKEEEIKQRPLPAGRFRYESGSYGGPERGYLPSIICYKQLGPDSWESHFCLVKTDTILEDEDAATVIAERHLAAAQAVIAAGGSPQDFALSLRHEGYNTVSDYHIARDEG